MKSHSKSTIKLFCLSVILSFFIFGLYTPGLLANNNKSGKIKTHPKTQNDKKIKIVILDDNTIIEELRQIEEWMLNIQLKEDEFAKHRQLEEWMFDENFWIIEKPFWEEEPIEEHRKIEDWMDKFTVKRVGCIDLYSDFIEKDWMKAHTFFIL